MKEPKTKKIVYVDPIVVLRDPTTRLRLKAYLDECSDLKEKVTAMSESLSDATKAISEDLKLTPKVVKQLMKMHYDNNFEQRQAELDEMSEIIQLMCQEESE